MKIDLKKMSDAETCAAVAYSLETNEFVYGICVFTLVDEGGVVRQSVAHELFRPSCMGIVTSSCEGYVLFIPEIICYYVGPGRQANPFYYLIMQFLSKFSAVSIVEPLLLEDIWAKTLGKPFIFYKLICTKTKKRYATSVPMQCAKRINDASAASPKLQLSSNARKELQHDRPSLLQKLQRFGSRIVRLYRR